MRRGEADFWIASDALDYNAIWTSCRWKTVNIRFFLNRYFPFRDRARTDLIKSDDQHYDVCSIGSGVRYQIFKNRKISDSSFYFVPNFNFQFCHMLRILNVETKYFISRKECDFPLSMWTYFNILIFRKISLPWLTNIVTHFQQRGHGGYLVPDPSWHSGNVNKSLVPHGLNPLVLKTLLCRELRQFPEIQQSSTQMSGVSLQIRTKTHGKGQAPCGRINNLLFAYKGELLSSLFRVRHDVRVL